MQVLALPLTFLFKYLSFSCNISCLLFKHESSISISLFAKVAQSVKHLGSVQGVASSTPTNDFFVQILLISMQHLLSVVRIWIYCSTFMSLKAISQHQVLWYLYYSSLNAKCRMNKRDLSLLFAHFILNLQSNIFC